MITITVSPLPGGRDHACAEYEGVGFEASSGSGACMAVAREMIFAQVPDQPWEAVGLDGRPRLRGPSLLGLARSTVSEAALGAGPRFRAWKTIDKGVPCPRCGRSEFLFHALCLACETPRTAAIASLSETAAA